MPKLFVFYSTVAVLHGSLLFSSTYQLFKYQRFYHDIRKYAFLSRIKNTWNSLPDFVVNIDSINIFKNRLDTFWSDQDIMFDYTAELTGIGDRSEFINEN